jgi:hypothetical protein
MNVRPLLLSHRSLGDKHAFLVGGVRRNRPALTSDRTLQYIFELDMANTLCCLPVMYSQK